MYNGSAQLDNCGTCDSNPNNDCLQDCSGVWGGDALEDNCGVCDSNPANDCTQDCAGVWGGSAYFDDCGICDDIPENDCVPCDDVSIELVSSIDPTCFGEPNGSISVNLITQEGDFTFSWNNGSENTNLTGLEGGIYQATLTQGDCSAFIEVELTEPAPLSLSFEDIQPDECSEANSGGCIIIAEGGTPPYSYEYNGITFSQTTFSNLAGGSYFITVTDASGCNVSNGLFIETVGCDTLSSSSLTGDYCNSSNEISETIFAIPVGEATSYEWELTNQEGEIVLIETISNDLTALEHSQLLPGIIYNVRVRGLNPIIPSSLGESCSHIWELAQPNLIIDDCEFTEISMGDFLEATTVNYAQNYEYRFDNDITSERVYEYSDKPSLELLEGSELVSNVLYNVSVRISYNGNWGEFGESCKIIIHPEPLTTGLLDEFCGNLELILTNLQLEVQPIPEATVYQTVFANIEFNQRDTIEHSTSSILPEQLSILDKNVVYQTRSRAFAKDQWTAWGNECQIEFIDDDNNLNLSIYPNPIRSGETLTLRAKGDWLNTQCVLKDITGRVLREQAIDLTQNQEIQFRVPNQASGMYLLTIRHGKQELTKKLIID
ncbi:MAG: T9SS type A sorting domain-containing protein [Bacteroidota bacterium]